MTTYPEVMEEIQAPAAPSIPHNREAEEAAIGSVLIDPNCIHDLLPFLKSEHFYIERHKWIWDAYTFLEQRGDPIDLITVTAELNRREQLAELGGPAYLTALINLGMTTYNAESYGRIVHSHYVRRQIIKAANDIAAIGYDEEIEIEEGVDKVIQATADLNILNTSKNNFIQIGNLFSKVYDDVEIRAKDPKEIWGLSTGLPKFDKKTGGVQQGELVYLVGAPAVGKTWLDLGWSMEFGKQAPGAVFSLEMKQLAIGRRLMSGLSGVSTRSMKSGFIEDREFPLLASAIDEYSKLPIWIDDSLYDTKKLRATLAWLKREYGIKWFTLDYALLLQDQGRDEIAQTQQISANLKRIVHDLNLCGVVLHSVVKVGMENSQPRMADQRGSGQAIHDADVQLFLTQPYEKDEQLQGIQKPQLKRMSTLWCVKGRELEESKFLVHLVRKQNSPFWGEFAENKDGPRY